jgi:hypothetical protein
MGAAFAFGIVEVTEIVVDDPDVEVCNFAGNGFPGAFLPIAFLASFGLTIFGERFAVFLAIGFFATAFFTGFFAADLTGFFTDGLLLFFAVFLNNLRMATIPPGGAKVMACRN